MRKNASRINSIVKYKSSKRWSIFYADFTPRCPPSKILFLLHRSSFKGIFFRLRTVSIREYMRSCKSKAVLKYRNGKDRQAIKPSLPHRLSSVITECFTNPRDILICGFHRVRGRETLKCRVHVVSFVSITRARVCSHESLLLAICRVNGSIYSPSSLPCDRCSFLLTTVWYDVWMSRDLFRYIPSYSDRRFFGSVQRNEIWRKFKFVEQLGFLIFCRIIIQDFDKCLLIYTWIMHLWIIV